MKRNAFFRGAMAVAAALVLAACQSPTSSVANPGTAAEVDPAAPAYPEPATGVTAYVDWYKTNQSGAANSTPATNAAIQLLAQFNNLWASGGNGQSFNPNAATAYKTGIILNSAVFAGNYTYVANVTAGRSAAQADAAWFDDRHGKTYSTITGFGPLASAVYTGTGITTTLTTVPSDAATYAYNDAGNDYGSSSITSANGLFDVVNLIRTVRASGASTNPTKYYFNSPRPWRVNSQGVMTENTATLDTGYFAADRTTAESYPTYTSSVSVVPGLLPSRSTTASTDGGFPSGHTAESYNTGLLMAFSVPERFQEILTRSSDLGQNRILAGMHSPLDVMGGRMLATALTAAGLYDSANAGAKSAAYTTAHSYLETASGTTDATFYAYAHSGTSGTDPFYDHDTNKRNFEYRLTYGLNQIGIPGRAAVVPKGAEVLLETRFPYLSASLRREVLRTTALDSGYPLLDDPEGWGRLNLFAAADGFGQFTGTIYANLDGTKVSTAHNPYYGADTWRNNINGSGRLVKQGSGTLSLTGYNSYSGGTRVEAGTLVAKSASALGSGDVKVQGGVLESGASAALVVSGNFTQLSAGQLTTDLGTGTAGQLSVAGTASLAGTLVVNLATAPVTGTTSTVLTANGASGRFASIVLQVGGAASTASFTPTYSTTGLTLTF